MRIEPNPARGEAFVRWSGDAGAVVITVVDASGREALRDGGVVGREHRLDLRRVGHGSFVVTVRSGAAVGSARLVVP